MADDKTIEEAASELFAAPAPTKPANTRDAFIEQAASELYGTPLVVETKDPLKVGLQIVDSKEKMRAMRISRQLNIPTEVAEKNPDFFDTEIEVQKFDKQINEVHPETRGFLTRDPDRGALFQEEIQSLDQVADAFIKIRKPTRDRPSVKLMRSRFNRMLMLEDQTTKRREEFFSEVPEAVTRGYLDLGKTLIFQGVSTGTINSEEALSILPELYQEIDRRQAQRPDFRKEFDKFVLDRKGKDVRDAWRDLLKELNTRHAQSVLDALLTSKEGATLIWEALDLGYESVIKRPRGTLHFVLEQLGFATPSIISSIGASIAGGAFFGPPGMAVGGLLGPFIGGVPVELGASVEEDLIKADVDVRDTEQLRAAFNDPKLMAKLRTRGLKKGLTIATIDSMFQAFGFSAARRAATRLGKAGAEFSRRAVRAATGTARETVGEITGEFTGQLVREDFDLSKVDPFEALMEGFASLSQSLVQVGIAEALPIADPRPPGGEVIDLGDIPAPDPRDKYPDNTVEATEQLSVDTQKALKAEHDAQMLNEAADTIQETTNLKEIPDNIAELVEVAGGDEASRIYFQSDDWDKFWTDRGQSPSEVAENVLEDGGQAYDEARQTGGAIEVPLSAYAAKLLTTPEAKELNNIARVHDPDGFTVAEADAHIKQTPGILQKLSQEAEGAKTQLQNEEQAEKIGTEIARQLRTAGQSPEGSVLVEKFLTSTAERTGIPVDEIFDTYKVSVGFKEKITVKPTGEQFNQLLFQDSSDTPEGNDRVQRIGNVLDATALFRAGRPKRERIRPFTESELDEVADESRAEAERQIPDAEEQTNEEGETFFEVEDETGDIVLVTSDLSEATDARETAVSNLADRIFDEEEISRVSDVERAQQEIETILTDERDLTFTERETLRDEIELLAQEIQDDPDRKEELESEIDAIQQRLDRAPLPQAQAQLQRLKDRFSRPEDAQIRKNIDKAQDPKKGPYVTDITNPMSWIPNFKAEPQGVIGPARLQAPHENVRKTFETDPFKWSDSKFAATKNLIRKHKDQNIPLVINTSSDLVSRVDYIAEMPEGTIVNMYLLPEEGGIGTSGLAERNNRLLFPGNPSRLRQIKAVESLRKTGITVNAIEPTVDEVIKVAGGVNRMSKQIGVKPKDVRSYLEQHIKVRIDQDPETLTAPTLVTPKQERKQARDTVEEINEILKADTILTKGELNQLSKRRKDIDALLDDASDQEHARLIAELDAILEKLEFSRSLSQKAEQAKKAKAQGKKPPPKPGEWAPFNPKGKGSDNIRIRFVFPDGTIGTETENTDTREQFAEDLKISKKGSFNFKTHWFKQIKSVRYGRPSGNLFLSVATDQEGKVYTAFDKDRNKTKEKILKGGSEFKVTPGRDMLGEDKPGLLVVGFTTKARQILPFFVLQQYDVNVIFKPSTTNDFTLRAVLISRTDTKVPARVVEVKSHSIEQGLEELAGAVTAVTTTNIQVEPAERKGTEKLNTWLTTQVFRLPKIAAKDVLSLKPFKPKPLKDRLKIKEPKIEETTLKKSTTLFQDEPPDLPKKKEPVKRAEIELFDKQAEIRLTKASDPTSFFHEAGHWFLEVFGRLAEQEGAEPSLIDDWQTTLDFLGVKSKDELGNDQHEQWARAFESYIGEGKAPSVSLRRVFQEFKKWVIDVYGRLLNLNVELNDDIRGVMDRLLATEEEIAEAEKTVPAPMTPESLGLRGKAALDFTTAANQALLDAEESLTKEVIQDWISQNTKERKKLRVPIRNEVEQEVNQRPEQKALSIIQTGKLTDGTVIFEDGAMKMNRADIVSIRGEEALKNLKGLFVTSGGSDPNVISDAVGFNTAEEMLVALERRQPKKQIIEGLTDVRMTERHGDMLTDGELQEQAIKAVHNEGRSKLLRRQMQILADKRPAQLGEAIRRIVKRPPPDRVVKADAEKIIGQKPIQTIQPNTYLLAERRSARRAGEALARGDFGAAFDEKRNELFNHEMYRAAVIARENVRKTRKRFKRFFGKDEKLAKVRNMNFVNAGRAILDLYGFGPGTVTDPLSHLEAVKLYDEDQFNAVVPIVNDAILKAGPFNDISYNSFLSLKDTTDAVWTLSKLAHELVIDGENRNFFEIRDQLIEEISALKASQKELSKYKKTVGKFEKVKLLLLGYRSALLRAENYFDALGKGDIDSLPRRAFWFPISENADNYRVEKQDVLYPKLVEIIKPLKGTFDSREIEATELKDSQGRIQIFSQGMFEVFGTLVHIGNPSNYRKLLVGRDWGTIDEDGNLDDRQWIAFRNRMFEEGKLTKAHMEAVQKIWDLFEELKPRAQQAHFEQYGFFFAEVTKHDVVTPVGTFKGGYYPALPDQFETLDRRQEEELLKTQHNSQMFPSARRDFTKRRVENYAVPLSLDIRNAALHLDKVLQFIHLGPAVKRVARLALDPKMRATLDNIDRTNVDEFLVPWLKRSARQQVEAPPPPGLLWKSANNLARTIRRRTGMNIMFGNIPNTLQQFTGPFLTAAKTRKPFRVLNNTGKVAKSVIKRNFAKISMFTDDKILEQVMNDSKFMRTRVSAGIIETVDEYKKILLDPGPFEIMRDFMQKHSYFLQVWAQSQVDLVSYLSGYEQAILEGKTHESAVRNGDSMVRLTQGSFAAEDIARIGSGTAVARVFTMFTDFFNMQANLLGSEFKILMEEELGLKSRAGRMIYLYFFGFVASSFLGDLIMELADGKLDEDDDDQYLDDLFGIFFSSQFRTASAFFPGPGQIVSFGFNRLNDKWWDDRLNLSPAVSAIERGVGGTVGNVYKLLMDKDINQAVAARDFLTLMGLTTGIPFQVLGKPIGFAINVREGKVESRGPIDFTRGLLTGRGARR